MTSEKDTIDKKLDIPPTLCYLLAYKKIIVIYLNKMIQNKKALIKFPDEIFNAKDLETAQRRMHSKNVKLDVSQLSVQLIITPDHVLAWRFSERLGGKTVSCVEVFKADKFKLPYSPITPFRVISSSTSFVLPEEYIPIYIDYDPLTKNSKIYKILKFLDPEEAENWLLLKRSVEFDENRRKEKAQKAEREFNMKMAH